MAPFEQTSPQETRLDSECLADCIKRERSLPTFADQPLLGLGVQALARTIPDLGVVLETSQRVLEQRHHQFLDRPDRAVVASRVVVLLRRNYIRNEQGPEHPVFPVHRTSPSLSPRWFAFARSQCNRR